MSARELKISIGTLQDFFAGDDILIIDEKQVDNNDQARMADILRSHDWFIASSDYDDYETAKPYIDEVKKFGCEVLMPWDTDGTSEKVKAWMEERGIVAFTMRPAKTVVDEIADAGIVDWVQNLFKKLGMDDIAVIAGLAVAHLNGEKR